MKIISPKRVTLWPWHILVLFFLLNIGCVYTYGRDEWQSWNDISIKYKISENSGLLFSPEIKIGDDISDLFSWRLRQGVFFDYNENLILGFNYSYQDEKNDSGVWRDEHRLEAFATIKWNLGGLKFSDRNKYEYRMWGNR